MKTNKNTQYNHKRADIALDIIIILLSLCITLSALFFFSQNLNKTFVRTDKISVGSVTFKYKTVQRKFLDRAVWDRPVQHSPVYNGDTIRTAPDAEATLHFDDTSVVEIGSSTMIQIFVADDEAALHLEGGAVSVRTGGDAKMLVQSKTASLNVAQGSVVHAERTDAATLRLAVEQGEASFIPDTAADGIAATDGTEGGAQVLRAGDVAARGTAAAALMMIHPAPNAKILNPKSDGSAAVAFAWHSSFPKDEELILETADTRDFRAAEKIAVKGVQEVRVAQKNGTRYWRLYSAKAGAQDASAARGRISVIAAPAPQLLLPAMDEKYAYKNSVPPVHFLWKGNDVAASYLLEVADNPDMRAPQISRSTSKESLTLTAFAEGTWYWRVTPRYLIGTERDVQPSAVSLFRVERRPDTAAPEVLMPKDVADTAHGKDVSFSWKHTSETKNYRVQISGSADMKNPIVDSVVNANYFELPDAAQILPNGDYYWTVTGLAKDGSVVSTSDPRKFTTNDSARILRTVFPPDGYILADTLCRDMRFTWKTNMDSEQRFQVAAAKDFAALTVDAKTQGSGIEGIMLPQGEWYWRIVASDGTRDLATEAKKLVVAPPLGKPDLIGISKLVIVHPEGKNDFAWTSVSGVDYYQVKIAKAEMAAVPVYENLFVTKNGMDMLLQSIEEGTYVISVQGFASPTLASSRRYGLAVDHYFELRHLKPIELVSPADVAVIAGVDALLHPSLLRWSSVETPVNAVLVLEKAGARKPVLVVNNPGFTVRLPPLEAGKYVWRVKAFSPDGLNISSLKDFAFSVAPVQPLPAARIVFPANNEVFGPPYFKANRSIDFRWNPVEDATHYIVTLYDAKRRVIFTGELPANKNERELTLSFTELSRLSRGQFYLEIKAQRRMENGLLFQDGTAAKVMFAIDLPESTTIQTEETGVLYGK